MAGQLNLSLVLKADASGFKGEIAGAAGAVKELGNQVSAGTNRATAARWLGWRWVRGCRRESER